MSPADAWQRSGMPSDRSYPSGGAPRFDRDRDGDEYVPHSPRSGPPPPRKRSASGERPASGNRSRQAERMRAPERRHPDEAGGYRRPPAGRSPGPRSRVESGAPAEHRQGDPRASVRPPREGNRPVDTGGGWLRGLVAVLAVFLVTLAACGVESYLGSGLGIITLIALVGSAALAALLVRRRDLVSVLVAPPLVFVAVAGIDVIAAPSASFSLATLATLLIRGFPAMALATGAALVIGLIRLAARR